MSSRAGSSLNRRLKRWPGWLLLAAVLVGLMAFGVTRDRGVQSQSDRVDEITKRVACPVCDGESVFESRNNASRAIRNTVAELVRENELSDDDIVGYIEARNGAQVLLVPRASGIDALVWVLPAVGFVLGAAGLAAAFRRWKQQSESLRTPTDADRERVAAALADDGER